MLDAKQSSVLPPAIKIWNILLFISPLLEAYKVFIIRCWFDSFSVIEILEEEECVIRYVAMPSNIQRLNIMCVSFEVMSSKLIHPKSQAHWCIIVDLVLLLCVQVNVSSTRRGQAHSLPQTPASPSTLSITGGMAVWRPQCRSPWRIASSTCWLSNPIRNQSCCCGWKEKEQAPKIRPSWVPYWRRYLETLFVDKMYKNWSNCIHTETTECKKRWI